MSRSRAAQSTRAQQITPAASLDLACSLIQVGIADICHVREILPDDAFKTCHIDDTKIIDDSEDASEESTVINSWVTVSVREALESGYASKLIFGLSTDPDCRNILEEYVFMFEHDEDGNITISSMGGGNGKKKSAKKPDVLSAKKQVTQLLRSIVSITQTLEPIPDERYVFCKMEYSEDCPEDYQPPGFEDAGDRAVGFFSTKPFTMRIGNVTTPYHNVMLGVRSVLDTVDIQPGKGPMGDNVSRWETTMMTQATGDDGGCHEDAEDPRGHTADDLADLFSEPQLPSPRLPKKPAAKQKKRDSTADVTDDFVSLQVKESGPLPSYGGNKSCAGGIHSMPGSLCTQSQAVNAVSQAAKAPALNDDEMSYDDEEEVKGGNAGGYWPESQISGDVRRKRKTSIVEHPIHQDTKRKRTAKAPARYEQVEPQSVAPKKKAGRVTRRGIIAKEN